MGFPDKFGNLSQMVQSHITPAGVNFQLSQWKAPVV